jgi:glycosyltransferase involved in cell wall biosynthesis
MELSNPLISIVIPTYNAKDFIKETIECWLNQTYNNLEIIVQDDCSTDGTWELVIKLYSTNNRVFLFRNKKNLGIGKNWNEAYNHAKGTYITIFNADDIVKLNFIEVCLGKFNSYKDISFVCCTAMRRDITLTKDLWNANSFKGLEGIFNDFGKRGESRERLLAWQFTLAKRDALKELEENGQLFYPTQCCDGDLWLRINDRKKYKAYYTEEIMGYYRTHENNNSGIPFGEFESTYADLAPRHPSYFKSTIFKNPLNKFKLLLQYIYTSIKRRRSIKMNVVKNYIFYEYFGFLK